MSRLKGFFPFLLIILWAGGCPFLYAAPTAKPDLKVTQLLAERVPTQAVPLRVDITIRILNSGASTGATRFITRLYHRTKSSDPWQPLFDWPSGAVAAGGGAVYNKHFDFTESGTYFFKATVDAENTVAEIGEGNNSMALTKSFQAGTPDLIVSNAVASTTQTAASGAMSIKAEWDVENIGDGKAVGSYATVLYVSKNSGGWNEVQRYIRTNLDKSEKAHMFHTGFFTNFNSIRFKITVDETHKIQEKLEGNNSAFSNTIKR